MGIQPNILVHGGAGGFTQPARDPARIKAIEEALLTGRGLLASGGSALDAVEQAVRVMEACGEFDAGRGSNLNSRGEVEQDAIVMTSDYETGAVGALKDVVHAVTVARLVMERTQHVLLVGEGAREFAQANGIPLEPPGSLVRERTLAELKRVQAENSYAGKPVGTVGAVALDAEGRLAAATSTGGITNKLPGRVGDTPLVGCGVYVCPWAACSATGWGESLIKVVVAKTACDLVEQGRTPQQAAEGAIAVLAERVGGRGGLVVMDPQGRTGWAFNTQQMALGRLLDGQHLVEIIGRT